MPVITVWPTLGTTEGRVLETAWDAFCDRLEAYGQEPFRGDMAQPGWSPARVEPPVRADANVVAMTALVLDYDGGETLEEAERMWSVFCGFIHTTRKHTDSAHRFRVILPLTREISRDEHALLWRYVVRTSGHRVDPVTKNPSRFWYVPGPSNGGGFRSLRLTGALLDPDPLLAEAAQEDAQRTSSTVTRIHPTAESRADRYAQAAIDDECNAVGMEGPGNRNNRLFVAACTAGNFIAAGNLAESYALDRLVTAARVCDLPTFEALRTIRSGIARGMKSPRQVPEPSSRAPNATASSGIPRSEERQKAGEPGTPPPEQAEAPKARSKALVDLIETQVSDGIFFPTGFARLDAELDDGGLPTGTLTVVLGGPGSRKTGLGTHFADHLSRLGAAVMFMACDESRKSIVTRLGQRAGFSRSGLRDKGDIGRATRAGQRRHEEELGRILRIVEIDDEEDAQTLEEAHEELLRVAEGRPRVLVIDSLQTTRCAASEALPQTAESMRLRVDAKVNVLKRIKKTGTLAIVISEVARAFYNGSQKRVEKEHVLSAAKESGGVEFGVDLLMGLVRSKSEDNTIELVVAKSRIGSEPRFWLMWNRDRAKLEEIADPTTAEERKDQEASRAQEVRQTILGALLKHPGLSKTKLRAATKLERGLICQVVDELVLDGVLIEGPKNAYRVCPQYGVESDGEA